MFSLFSKNIPYSNPHIFMVLSSDAETIFLPSGLYEAERTSSVCPVKVCKHVPVFASHIFMVLSPDAEIIFVPSGLYDAEIT